MSYSVGSLAKMSGVSTRTLRWYDRIGLLSPTRGEENGYRYYEDEQLDRLQQILFFRELGFELKEIGRILDGDGFDRLDAMNYQLTELEKEKERLELLIGNVKRSIDAMEGGSIMSDKEKFMGFKQEQIAENERKYGAELRKKYGDEAIDASIFKLKGMSEERWQYAQELGESINTLLAAAMAGGDSKGAAAKELFEKHREWLKLFWADGQYSPAAHASLALMYEADERFSAYYEKAAGVGAAGFLREVIENFTKEN